jgi:hypothetical protein
MIRNLAQCPYCGKCEVVLDETPALVFNPDGTPGPCPHLAWVDGRYSQWDQSAHGTDHVIGSTEFRWNPPEPGVADRAEGLLPYLRELVNQKPGWVFAPSVPIAVRTLSAEEKREDKNGHLHTLWDVDGWAIFAADVAAFWQELPACQQRQRESLWVAGDKPEQ